MNVNDYHEDDRPRDLTKYNNMSREELEAEIAKLEAKVNAEKKGFENCKKAV